MSKTKKNNASRKNQTPKKSGLRKSKSPSSALDSAGLAYSKLLSDPCGSPLVPPVYTGSESGFLFRAEQFANFGDVPLATSGCLHWTPGYPNSSSTELLALATASGAASGTMGVATDSAGRSFLLANAKGCRCVAACLRVTYPGTESGRSGRIHYGHAPAGTLDAGQSVSPNGYAQLLQHYSRTPADTIELIWKPNAADMNVVDPSETAIPALRDQRASICVAWAGLPVQTGLTFHFTAVYEWFPSAGIGLASNTIGKSLSRNTLDDIVNFLIRNGETFVRGAHLNGALPSILSSVYGMMASRQHTRARISM